MKISTFTAFRKSQAWKRLSCLRKIVGLQFYFYSFLDFYFSITKKLQDRPVTLGQKEPGVLPDFLEDQLMEESVEDLDLQGHLDQLFVFLVIF